MVSQKSSQFFSISIAVLQCLQLDKKSLKSNFSKVLCSSSSIIIAINNQNEYRLINVTIDYLKIHFPGQ